MTSSKRTVVLLAVAAAVMAAAALQPAEAMRARRKSAASAWTSSETRAFRFPGFTRRGFPGFPGGRSSSSPRAAAPRPSPPPPPSVPAVPISSPPSPPCGRPATQQPMPGFPVIPSTPGSSSGGGGGFGGSSSTDCVTPLAGLTSCASFLTGSEVDSPVPQSECCSGLGMFLNSTAAAGGDADRTLRCLCPVILGDVNRMLPKPIDPVRMMYLPIACGVVLPPQVLFICFTGQPNPHILAHPNSWAKYSGLSP